MRSWEKCSITWGRDREGMGMMGPELALGFTRSVGKWRGLA